MKKARSYEKFDRKSNRFGGLKAPRNPVSVGEEYIVTIEETSKSGTGLELIRLLPVQQLPRSLIKTSFQSSPHINTSTSTNKTTLIVMWTDSLWTR